MLARSPGNLSPVTDFEPVDERGGGSLAPAENVRVRLRVPEGKRVASVEVFGEKGLPRRQAPSWRSTPEGLELRLPKVGAYRGVAFE